MTTTEFALTLHTLPYGEHHRIVTFYGAETGRFTCFVKGSKRKPLFYLHPMTLVEISHTLSKGSLHKAESVDLVDSHLHLRQDRLTLETTLKMKEALLQFPPEGVSYPELFTLLVFYLKELPKAPVSLLASLHLKLMRLEGLYTPQFFEKLEDPIQQKVSILAESRSLKEIMQTTLSEALQKMISDLFFQSVQNPESLLYSS